MNQWAFNVSKAAVTVQGKGKNDVHLNTEKKGQLLNAALTFDLSGCINVCVEVRALEPPLGESFSSD